MHTARTLRLPALTLGWFAAILVGAEARAEGPAGMLSVDTAASSLTYKLVHKLHKFEGVSKKLEGKAKLAPDGRAQVMIRAPIVSFDSENVNRDAHMKEVVEAARFGFVDLKATGEVPPPTSYPSTVTKVWKGQIEFHGVQQVMDLPVKITFESANKVVAESSFKISLDAFKIERPSLMFVKVEDDVAIEAKVSFVK